MQKIIYMLLGFVGIMLTNHAMAQSAPDTLLAQDTNFSTLEHTVQPIEEYIDVGVTSRWATGVRDFVINTFYDVAFPFVFAVGLLMAILGIMRLLFSSQEEDRSKAFKIILWGIIGIVLIVSARYITYTILGETGNSWVLFWEQGNVSWLFIAQDLYDRLIIPFIRIGFMLIVGVLFIVLLLRVFWFLFKPSDDNRKQSLAIIGWNAIGILVIIGARFIVELIYGTKDDVINQNATQLNEIGTPIFSASAATWSLGLFYAIINWVVGLTSLLILVIIIWQAYQLLTNPEDESKLAKVGRSLLYIFIGIVIIGLAYIVANVVLVQ